MACHCDAAKGAVCGLSPWHSKGSCVWPVTAAQQRELCVASHPGTAPAIARFVCNSTCPVQHAVGRPDHGRARVLPFGSFMDLTVGSNSVQLCIWAPATMESGRRAAISTWYTRTWLPQFKAKDLMQMVSEEEKICMLQPANKSDRMCHLVAMTMRSVPTACHVVSCHVVLCHVMQSVPVEQSCHDSVVCGSGYQEGREA